MIYDMEIITNILLVGGGVAAIVYGVIGFKNYTKRELWWSILGITTICVDIWSYLARHSMLPFGDEAFAFWSRQLAMFLLFLGWLALLNAMGYLGKKCHRTSMRNILNTLFYYSDTKSFSANGATDDAVKTLCPLSALFSFCPLYLSLAHDECIRHCCANAGLLSIWWSLAVGLTFLHF